MSLPEDIYSEPEDVSPDTLANLGPLARLAGEWKIFAQREIRVALPHEDAAQVRMALKADAEHIPDFALMPVGRAPDRQNARQLGFLLRNVRFEPKFDSINDCAQVINHRPTRIVAVIIVAANIHQIVQADAFGVLRFVGGANATIYSDDKLGAIFFE